MDAPLTVVTAVEVEVVTSLSSPPRLTGTTVESLSGVADSLEVVTSLPLVDLLESGVTVSLSGVADLSGVTSLPLWTVGPQLRTPGPGRRRTMWMWGKKKMRSG